MEIMLERNVIQKNAYPVRQQKGEGGQQNIGDAEQQANFAMVTSKHLRCQNTTGAGFAPPG